MNESMGEWMNEGMNLAMIQYLRLLLLAFDDKMNGQ
jgi:hypothetical protein